MRKSLTLVLMLLFVAITTFAQHIDSSSAEELAKTFLIKSTSTSGSQRVSAQQNLKLAYKGKAAKSNMTTFYIYNIEGGGFVIVSADKRAKSILGYSNDSTFDPNNIPINMKNWLDSYNGQIEYAVKNIKEIKEIDAIKEKTISLKSKKTEKEVKPLLGNIKYDQGSPYNDQCPYDSIAKEITVTGCVATAIVQVMKYYEWPVKGKGSHSYTHTKYGKQSANFDTNYDWKNIKDSYSNTNSKAEKDAIAKLMYHIGVSVDMDYGLSKDGGSGAITSKAVYRLFENFDYDAGIENNSREFFSNSEWNNMLIAELDASRPMIYSGGNSEGAGHAFVCDGYNKDGFFHFNWGWGGYANGYFENTALQPGYAGIGSNNGGYNFRQEVITGIQKPISDSKHKIQIGTYNGFINVPTSVDKKDKFSFDMDIFNIGGFSITNPTIKLIIFKGGKKYADLCTKVLSGDELDPYYGWKFTISEIGLSDTIPTGDYEIRPFFKNEKDEFVPMKVTNGIPNKVLISVTNDSIFFTKSSDTADVKLIAAPVVKRNIYQNKPAIISIKVANLGTLDYYAQIGAELISQADTTVREKLVTSLENIDARTTEKEITLSSEKTTLAPGKYTLRIYYDDKNQSQNHNFPTTQMGGLAEYNNITITIEATPTEAPILTISNIICPSKVVKNTPFTITADITNSGGLFYYEVLGFVFPAKGGYSLTHFGYQSLILDKGETVNVKFTGTLSLDVGKYIYTLYHTDSNHKYISFGHQGTIEVIDATTEVLNNSSQSSDLKLSLFNNILSINSHEKIANIEVVNMNGQILNRQNRVESNSIQLNIDKLSKGVYMVKILTTNNSIIVKKFVK